MMKLALDSSRYKIVAGYGSPEVSDVKPGDPITFSTEFPSLKNIKGEWVKGGWCCKGLSNDE